MKHRLIILIAAEIILLLSVLMLLITTIKVETSFAYVTQSSSGIAAADPNYCDNASHYPTCYDIGYKGGLIDGQQHVQNGVRYSALAACVGVGSHSPNFCYGYIEGYNKAYGRYFSSNNNNNNNNVEIWNMGNATGFDIGINTVKNNNNNNHFTVRSCTEGSTIFCNGYAHGYLQGRIYGQNYWPGYLAGVNAADRDISKCNLQNYSTVKIPGYLHYSQEYIQGFRIGYSDTASDAANDDNTYGSGCPFK
ncbi:MAG TPA: hypothetical protein VIP56_08995 [Nitrososphaeraceae archaeon]